MGVYVNLLMGHPLEPRLHAASPAELLESVGHHQRGSKCPAGDLAALTGAVAMTVMCMLSAK